MVNSTPKEIRAPHMYSMRDARKLRYRSGLSGLGFFFITFTAKAGAPGFEPRSTDPKSGVLPLHYAPKTERRSTRTVILTQVTPGDKKGFSNCHAFLKVVLARGSEARFSVVVGHSSPDLNPQRAGLVGMGRIVQHIPWISSK